MGPPSLSPCFRGKELVSEKRDQLKSRENYSWFNFELTVNCRRRFCGGLLDLRPYFLIRRKRAFWFIFNSTAALEMFPSVIARAVRMACFDHSSAALSFASLKDSTGKLPGSGSRCSASIRDASEVLLRR